MVLITLFFNLKRVSKFYLSLFIALKDHDETHKNVDCIQVKTDCVIDRVKFVLSFCGMDYLLSTVKHETATKDESTIEPNVAKSW